MIDPNLLVGIVLPPLIDVVSKRIPSESMRFVVACAMCLVVGGAVAYLKGDLTAGNQIGTVSTITIVFTESEVIFNLYWKNSFLRSKLVSQGTTPPLEQREVSPVG